MSGSDNSRDVECKGEEFETNFQKEKIRSLNQSLSTVKKGMEEAQVNPGGG